MKNRTKVLEKRKVLDRIKKLFTDGKDLLFPEYKLSEKEVRVLKTIERICKLPSTRYRVVPLENTYYIINEEFHFSIEVSLREVKIVNTNILYGYQFPLQFQEMLVNTVKKYILADLKQLEQDIFKSELDLLSKVEERIKNK